MEYFDNIFALQPSKIVLSKPKNSEYKKIVITKKKKDYQIESFTEKQAFHKNVSFDEVVSFCNNTVGKQFFQLNAWDAQSEHILLVSKKGRVTYKKKACANTVTTAPHNREKNYILAEGNPIPPLVDMGIFTKEGKIVRSMYDKFRQINRFVEIVDDAVKKTDIKHFNIIDFGCGKSYLTFILYYYFTEVRALMLTL